MPILIKHSIKGGKLKVVDLKELLKASYEKQPNNINDFEYDKSTSSKTSKVFVNKNTGQVVVTHKGTQGLSDWFNNIIYGVSGTTGYKLTPRYREAKRVQNNAYNKYGNENVTTIGHSQGGLQAELLGGKGREIITLNKATNPFEQSNKQKNQYDIKSSRDIVSSLNPLNIFDKVIKGETFNPISEHETAVLDRLENKNENVGYGIKKPLYKNKKTIKNYPNKQMPRKTRKTIRMYEPLDSESDSSSDSESDSECNDDEREIINCIKSLDKAINKHHRIHGGKLNIAKSVNKLGSTVKRGFESGYKEAKRGFEDVSGREFKSPEEMRQTFKVNEIKKAGSTIKHGIVDKFANPAGEYITAKKGGLASDLLHKGVPIVTGALAGVAGDFFGGPLGGIVAGELGSRAGQAGADALGKKIGVGIKRRGRPPKNGGDLIHIDIDSHNAKGKKALSKMVGGEIVSHYPVAHRGLDTTMSVPSFSQTKADKMISSQNALFNNLAFSDLRAIKEALSVTEPTKSLSPAQRNKIAKQMQAEFKKNMKRMKDEEANKHKPKRYHGKDPHLVKGSDAAKEHMAMLRAMRKNK